LKTRVVTPEAICAGLAGLTILDAEVGDDGFHLRLSDGRFFIIQGNFLISVCTLDAVPLTH
jgi:hypothetical protein